jgi:citrate lyase subunit beta/citryl-CoA lyase
MSQTSFTAGSSCKSDCSATYTPGPGGLTVSLDSKLSSLFGRAIRETALSVGAEFGAMGGIAIADDGALDYVVASRVEAALRAAGLKRKSGAAVKGAAVNGAGPRGGRAPSPRDRLRRSRLYLPGNQSDLPINSGLFGADCLLLDLEDSVAPERKAEARILVRRLLETRLSFFGDSEIAVRVNSLSSPFGLEDLAEIVPAFPQALILPKSETAADIEACDAEVSRLERAAGIEEGSIRFMPLIETAKGVCNAAAIASSSGRNVAICFGAEDYRRDLGVERSPDESETFVARSLIAMAAKAAGIGAQDSVFSNVDDEAGLEASTRIAKSLGFTGKGIVHPRQIAVVHRVFDPSEAEVEAARRVVAALDDAKREGKGVASLDGKMIDAPVAERARRLIARAASASRAGRTQDD